MIKTFTNGFFLIIMDSKEEKTRIMFNGPFLIDGVGFFIKDWVPNFKPKQAKVEEVPIWIRFYNLLHEYWNKNIFKMIGDKLGNFIKEDDAIEQKHLNQYARICIMWKPHTLLPHAIEIRTAEGY